MFNGITPSHIYESTFNAQNDREIKKELDKDAFLQLLVTELKYQDPTSPMDNKEFISQMSQLSTTEQITNMSQSFQNMVDSQMSLQKLNAAGLVGKNVVVKNNSVNLQDGISEGIIFNLEEQASVGLEIYDSNDKLVFSEQLGGKEAGVHSFAWDGRNNSGVAQKDGEYTYQLYKNVDGERVEIGGLDGGTVNSVQFLNNEFFVLVNGQRYPISAVQEISEAIDTGNDNNENNENI